MAREKGPVQNSTEPLSDYAKEVAPFIKIPEPYASLIRDQKEMRKRLPDADADTLRKIIDV